MTLGIFPISVALMHEFNTKGKPILDNFKKSPVYCRDFFIELEKRFRKLLRVFNILCYG